MEPPFDVQQQLNASGDNLQSLQEELREAELEAQKKRFTGRLKTRRYPLLRRGEKSLALWPTPWSILRKSRLSSGGKMNGQPFGSPRGCWLARTTSERQLDSFPSLWRPHVGGWSGCWNTLVAMADSKLSALYYSPEATGRGSRPSRSWRLQQR